MGLCQSNLDKLLQKISSLKINKYLEYEVGKPSFLPVNKSRFYFSPQKIKHMNFQMFYPSCKT
jgi:hypothetical protein